ncbi:hypothetical protein V5O48_004027 [Marasmius crinis-equi]|uniref:Uncharacterized protein n=1 Tax=Marasmius crinis-equi TaxID=585013 RepID=A0ABR3FR97_9AGAR
MKERALHTGQQYATRHRDIKVNDSNIEGLSNLAITEEKRNHQLSAHTSEDEDAKDNIPDTSDPVPSVQLEDVETLVDVTDREQGQMSGGGGPRTGMELVRWDGNTTEYIWREGDLPLVTTGANITTFPHRDNRNLAYGTCYIYRRATTIIVKVDNVPGVTHVIEFLQEADLPTHIFQLLRSFFLNSSEIPQEDRRMTGED